MKSLLCVVFLTQLTACALAPHRTYLAEMEEDDGPMFRPREDFPVVPGDSGRQWRSKDEWRRRTPASETMRLREREQLALERELVKLENSQSEGAFAHYQQYRSRLGSTSEKIYFLQLTSRAERDEYLEGRGLLEVPHVLTPYERGFARSQSEVVVGMTKEDVMAAWGRPMRIDVAGNPRNENERWLYQRDGAPKYIFFEGGVVEGWKQAQ